jgi:integrase
MIYKRDKSKYWWFKFAWNGDTIRESTKQSNKRVAEQMEAARRTQLAKGEVGIRDRKAAPTIAEFSKKDFMPHVRAHFANKPSTLAYYEIQVKHLTSYGPMASATVDAVTPEIISGFVSKWREAEYEVSSINRALQVLRRMLHLAVEWGKTEKAAPRVLLLPGEKRRERVLTPAEEAAYLTTAQQIGEGILEAYRHALQGIRATARDEQPIKPDDPFLLRDVATVLLDCGLRPEECYRLRWEHVRDNALHIPFGKTASARRSVPLSNRASILLDMRKTVAVSEWVFPAPTKTGHMEQSTLVKRHGKACELASIVRLPFYCFRHTCLTRWSSHMDPYTLAYFAGHSDFGTTRRYVHPNMDTGRAAMERARVPAPVVPPPGTPALSLTSSKPS